MSLPDLLTRLGCSSTTAAAVAQRVQSTMAEANLPYHNLDHVKQTLVFARAWRHLTPHPDLVALALWFHDLIYDPRRRDNEEKSATALRRWLSPTPISPAAIEEANRLILVTRNHDPHDDSAGLVVDADLSIWAAPRTQYRLYAAAIRQEYAWVDEPVYRTGRLAILEKFLARPFLFYHPPIQKKLEKDARQNLLWEIEQLRSE